MESLFGFTGADYTLIVADSAAMRSVVKFKDTEDKILEVDQFKLMGVTGPNGDRVHFTEFVLRNLHLYELSNGITLSTHAAANWTRFVIQFFIAFQCV
jgi:20S proteasome alpha/beta subunit